MKKPEFPKPRLIREDFLPEQDPLMNYRIKKVTKPNGEVWYYPQKKFLWFWWNIDIGITYDNEYWAQARVFEHYNNSQKNKVEYLAPDISHQKSIRTLEELAHGITQHPRDAL